MDAAPATAPDEGLAAALAAEIRAGGVDDADLETLRSELDVGVPRSVDVRIARLQSSASPISRRTPTRSRSSSTARDRPRDPRRPR